LGFFVGTFKLHQNILCPRNITLQALHIPNHAYALHTSDLGYPSGVPTISLMVGFLMFTNKKALHFPNIKAFTVLTSFNYLSAAYLNVFF
jgi:hypothetical protein